METHRGIIQAAATFKKYKNNSGNKMFQFRLATFRKHLREGDIRMRST